MIRYLFFSFLDYKYIKSRKYELIIIFEYGYWIAKSRTMHVTKMPAERQAVVDSVSFKNQLFDHFNVPCV